MGGVGEGMEGMEGVGNVHTGFHLWHPPARSLLPWSDSGAHAPGKVWFGIRSFMDRLDGIVRISAPPLWCGCGLRISSSCGVGVGPEGW